MNTEQLFIEGRKDGIRRNVRVLPEMTAEALMTADQFGTNPGGKSRELPDPERYSVVEIDQGNGQHSVQLVAKDRIQKGTPKAPEIIPLAEAKPKPCPAGMCRVMSRKFLRQTEGKPGAIAGTRVFALELQCGRTIERTASKSKVQTVKCVCEVES